MKPMAYPYLERQTAEEAIASMTESEKESLRQLWHEKHEPKPFVGTQVTLFFPEKYDLKPIDFVGQVPAKGQIIYTRNWWGRFEKERDYSSRSKWKVREVWISLYGVGNTKEDLLNNLPAPRAEVMLDYEHKWQDFMMRTWYPIRWKINDFKRSIRRKVLEFVNGLRGNKDTKNETAN